MMLARTTTMHDTAQDVSAHVVRMTSTCSTSTCTLPPAIHAPGGTVTMHQQENHVYDERKDHKNSKRITKTRKIMIPHQQHDGSTQCVRQRHHGSTRCARQRQQSALCTALLPTTPHFMHAQSIDAGADALLNTLYNDGQGKHNSLNATAAKHGSHPLTDASRDFVFVLARV